MLCFGVQLRSVIMRSAWKARAIAPLGVLVLGLSGCDSLLGSRTEVPTPEPSEEEAEEPVEAQALNADTAGTVLLNAEAGVELTIPLAWSEDMRLHDSAELQASDTNNELYIIVVAEEDKTLSRLGLRENAENYRRLLINQLHSLEGEAPTEVAFIGDNFASQYEIRGQVAENIPIVYLHTTVLIENRYYQIVAWTNPSQYDNAYKSELQNITQTFREVDATSQAGEELHAWQAVYGAQWLMSL